MTHNPWGIAYTTFVSSAGAASGVLPLAHATDGGGSIRIPAGSHGLTGLKSTRGVFSIAPALSDISGYVSTQGCVSRTLRDSALFIDSCRGGAPGEFMPYWCSDESYSDMIKRDPAPLRIAVSHQWGQYAADPHFVNELTRTATLLWELGHQVEWVTPEIDFEAAFSAQTTCYISNFAQFIQRLLEKKGLTGTPGISIPLAWQQSGIPLGMHFQTRQGNDGQLLQLAAQLERAMGGSFHNATRPAVHVAR